MRLLCDCDACVCVGVIDLSFDRSRWEEVGTIKKVPASGGLREASFLHVHSTACRMHVFKLRSRSVSLMLHDHHHINQSPSSSISSWGEGGRGVWTNQTHTYDRSLAARRRRPPPPPAGAGAGGNMPRQVW